MMSSQSNDFSLSIHNGRFGMKLMPCLRCGAYWEAFGMTEKELKHEMNLQLVNKIMKK